MIKPLKISILIFLACFLFVLITFATGCGTGCGGPVECYTYSTETTCYVEPPCEEEDL